MTRYCHYTGCTKLLVRRTGEKKQAFLKRVHCNRECSYKTLSFRRRKPIVHGTASGYNVHLRRDEEPCQECRDARLEWQRAHYSVSKVAISRAAARRRAMRLVLNAHYEEYQSAIKCEYEKLADTG